MTLTRKLLALVPRGGGHERRGARRSRADRFLRQRLTREAGRSWSARWTYLAAPSGRGAERRSSTRRSRGSRASTARRLTVIDSAGHVVADSDFPDSVLATLENHRSRPEFQAALRGAVGPRLPPQRLHRTVGVQGGGAGPGRRGARLGAGPAGGRRGRARRRAPCSSARSSPRRRRSCSPSASRAPSRGRCVRLRDASQAIARGERPVVDTRGDDEVGDLARALRGLEESLAERIGALERERSETAALVAAMVEGRHGVRRARRRGHLRTRRPAGCSASGTASRCRRSAEVLRPRAAQGGDRRRARRDSRPRRLEIDVGSAPLAALRAAAARAAARCSWSTTSPRSGGSRRCAATSSPTSRTSSRRRSRWSRGYAETLLGDEPPPDVRRSFLATILANATRMQRLVDDLLDLSRIESGAWTPQPGAARRSGPRSHQAWADVTRATAAGERAFAVELAPDAARGRGRSAGRSRQVLRNILDNAARYTPAQRGRHRADPPQLGRAW